METQPKLRRKSRPPASSDMEQDLTTPTSQPDMPHPASFQQLTHPDTSSVQRQKLATSISSQYGNAFLSRMLSGQMQRHVPPPATATPAAQTQNSTTLSSAVETILKASTQGQEALATMTTYKVQLEINDTNKPQYFPKPHNICKLNSKMSAETTASYFIHEMHHAKMDHTGQALDAETMTNTDENRKKFVDQHVTEEIVGTYKGVEGVLTFAESGKIVVESGKSAIPCYDDYTRIYNLTFDKKTGAGQAKAEAQTAAQKMARYAIRLYFDDPEGMAIKYKPFGGVLTYREHYGREWDRIQAKKQAEGK